MTDYASATAFLDARIGLGVKPGLERMRGLLDALADPHLAAPTIHVAGTNGKTSTVRFTAALLDAHGIVAGTFTSPHLEVIEERFGIGRTHLTAAQWAALVADVAPIVELYEERSGSGVTYFEATAVLAFNLFATYPVSAAVVEVGLGGRLDATNVVEPEVAVITSIGRDHMSYLGDDVAAIAAEKAAIIKEGAATVTGPLSAEAEAVVAARAADVGSPRFRLGSEFSIAGATPSVGGWVVDVDGVHGSYHDLELRSHGRHQVDNFALAVAAVECFFGRRLDESAVAAAATVSIPGRMEVLATSPLFMVDGAHNGPAAAALSEALEREFPSTRWSLVFGVMADKEPASMLEALAPRVDRLYAVAADSPRALDVERVAGHATAAGIPVATHPSVAAGVQAAVNDAGADGAVLVAGSLYVAGEARLAFTAAR